MEIQYASLFSFKVIIWQVLLGFIQYVGLKIGNRIGLLIAYLIVIIWTISKTYDGLLILQLIIQSTIAYFFYKSLYDKSNTDDKNI
ncbi:hypothetical protein KKA87_10410 [bacterium]|nr:hypothetical protein [bacterium]MBU1874300.1 hypothetical protein [bacterium]